MILKLVIFKFSQYFSGKLFSEFNSELIVGENIPYHPLNKDLMLVHGDQAAQNPGR